MRAIPDIFCSVSNSEIQKSEKNFCIRIKIPAEGKVTINDNIQGKVTTNNIEIDNIMYNDADCYTSSFASTPFFTLDIDSQKENDTIISRYITLALETDKFHFDSRSPP